jgi:hypothetical protein
MTHIRKVFLAIAAFFSAKSAIPAVTAEDYRAAMQKGAHSREECQRVTEAHLSKLGSKTL